MSFEVEKTNSFIRCEIIKDEKKGGPTVNRALFVLSRPVFNHLSKEEHVHAITMYLKLT